MPACYQPLWIAGAVRGSIREDLLPRLAGFPELESVTRGWQLAGSPVTVAERSERLQALAQELHRLQLIADWRDEECSLLDEHGVELARCERGAFRTLGFQNRSIHVNGYREDGRLWIARRSQRKKADPGKLDNLAAGAITAGESPLGAAIRELWEEAGVAASLTRSLAIAGQSLRSLRETRFGMHDELVLVADLLLPMDFVPEARDGEVERFFCWTPAEVLQAIERGDFTLEAALSIRHWLAIRMPIITPA